MEEAGAGLGGGAFSPGERKPDGRARGRASPASGCPAHLSRDGGGPATPAVFRSSRHNSGFQRFWAARRAAEPPRRGRLLLCFSFHLHHLPSPPPPPSPPREPQAHRRRRRTITTSHPANGAGAATMRLVPPTSERRRHGTVPLRSPTEHCACAHPLTWAACSDLTSRPFATSRHLFHSPLRISCPRSQALTPGHDTLM